MAGAVEIFLAGLWAHSAALVGTDVRVGQNGLLILAEEQNAYFFSGRILGWSECTRSDGKVSGLHEGLSFACWFRNRQCLGGVGFRMSIAAGGEQCGGTKCCRGAHERTTG